MKVTIDCFGHRNTDSERFLKQRESWIDIAEDSGGNTYLRFSSGDSGPIHRISTNAGGDITRRWAFGSWSDRESLTYSAGFSDVLNIDVED